MSDDMFDQIMSEAKEIVSRTKLEGGKIVPRAQPEPDDNPHSLECRQRNVRADQNGEQHRCVCRGGPHPEEGPAE